MIENVSVIRWQDVKLYDVFWCEFGGLGVTGSPLVIVIPIDRASKLYCALCGDNADSLNSRFFENHELIGNLNQLPNWQRRFR